MQDWATFSLPVDEAHTSLFSILLYGNRFVNCYVIVIRETLFSLPIEQGLIYNIPSKLILVKTPITKNVKSLNLYLPFIFGRGVFS
jgi:hypothetical protein